MQIFALPTFTVLLTLLGSSYAGIGCSPSFGPTFSKNDVFALQKEIVLNWDETTVPGPNGRWGLKWGTTQVRKENLELSRFGGVFHIVS